MVKIANNILTSQSAEIRLMHAWRKGWYGSATVDLIGAAALGMFAGAMGMEAMPGMIRGAKNIDKTFASMMVAHHRGAIAMAQIALMKAQHAQLRALAQRIIAAQGVTSLLQKAVGSDWKGKLSPFLYLAGILSAFRSPWIAQVLYAVVALIWIVPDRRIEQVIARDESIGH